MKIIFVAVFTPNSTNVSQSRGFKDNGYEVLEYDYRSKLHKLGGVKNRDNDLIKKVHTLKPDMVVFSKCNNMHHRVITECNKVSKTCMWYMDAMHNFDSELREKIKRCDYFFCGVEGVIPHGLKHNTQTFFLHQCPDEKLNFMLEDFTYTKDVTFIGSGDGSRIHGDRRKYINILNKHIKGFKHFNGVFGLKHNKIVNESKINLNFAPTDATGASVRIYKILAAGGFLMTTPWTGMEDTFTINEDIVIFKNEKEMLEKIKYYLNNEDERNIIRKNGYIKGQEYLPKRWAKKMVSFINFKENAEV